MIYILESGKYFKVGYSLRPFKDGRADSYFTHNPEYKLVAEFEGCKALEKLIHVSLSEYVFTIEWFNKFDNWLEAVKDLITNRESSVWYNEKSLPKKKQISYKDKVLIQSEDYLLVNGKVLSEFDKVLSSPDMVKLSLMITWLRGKYNLLSGSDGEPMTKAEVMAKLNYSRSRFSTMINNLIRVKAIFLVDGTQDGKKVKYILVNPAIARRSY